MRDRSSQMYEPMVDGRHSLGSLTSQMSPVADPGDQVEMTATTDSVAPDDTFTVDMAVDRIGFGRFQVRLSLLTGLCWMADSMEMMILSILSPAIQCSWFVSEWRQAFITTAVFIGMMVSSPFWGKFSDQHGRKTALLLSSVFLFYYGLLSSFSPTYVWLVILRSLVGFCIGAVPQAVTLYSEYLPSKQRGKCLVLMECFWAFGACLEVLLALVVMPTLGWRWLLALSALPLLIFVLFFPWMPESARYYAVIGQVDRAYDTLQSIAKYNGTTMPRGRLTVDEMEGVNRGRIRDLLVSKLRSTTLILWFIWWTSSFCYYGIVLVTTELLKVSHNDYCSASFQFHSNQVCQASCRNLQTSDYMELLLTTVAEFPGILFTVLIIEKLGRKKTMAIEFIGYAVALLMLFFCVQSRAFLTAILFVCRGMVAGVFQAAYVYTPEVYPTSLRAVGLGTCSSFARLGAMFTPLVAQVLVQISVKYALLVYASVSVLSAVGVMLLPLETAGRSMQ